MNGLSQCGGYSITVDRFKKQFQIIFFCGTQDTYAIQDATSSRLQEELNRKCEELILNHICKGRPTGVLGLLPDVR